MNEFLKEQEERNYWLQRGVQAERERIIKLLESEFDKGNEHICINCDTFALIKGEQE